MIYLIRHGKTDLNDRGVLQGRSNYPMNEEGIRQAREAAKKLEDISFDHVFSSPLTRAVQTAEIVAPGIRPVIDERLIEMEYGPYDSADLKNPPEEIVRFFSDFVNEPAPEGMEQLSSVVGRMGEFMEDIRNLEGNILVCTHAVAMKGALEYLDPESNGSYWSRFLKTCAVFALDNSGGQFGVPEEI